MGHMDGWYGVPGGWDMVPDMDDVDYDDMVDYDIDAEYDDED